MDCYHFLKYVVFCALFISGQTFAEIYKCSGSDGAINFTSEPCGDGLMKKKGKWVSVEEEARLEREREQERLAALERERIQAELQERLEKIKEEQLAALKKDEDEQRRRKYMEQEKSDKINLTYYEVLKESDDFYLYKDAFNKAAIKLIKARWCTARDFREMGGWLKSSNHKNKPIYFTYCGGMSTDRIYLNVYTGAIGE